MLESTAPRPQRIRAWSAASLQGARVPEQAPLGEPGEREHQRLRALVHPWRITARSAAPLAGAACA